MILTLSKLQADHVLIPPPPPPTFPLLSASSGLEIQETGARHPEEVMA